MKSKLPIIIKYIFYFFVIFNYKNLYSQNTAITTSPLAQPLAPSQPSQPTPSPSAQPLAPSQPSQPQPANPSSTSIVDKVENITKISPVSISDSISKILGDPSQTKIEILMFNDLELSNINRAIDSLKNNQIFVPEDEDKEDVDKTKEQEEAQRLAEEEKKEQEEMQESEKSYIYLGSIIYFNENDWVIWLNDQKITNSINLPEKEIFVEEIKANKVKIRWRMNLSKWKILSGKKDQSLAPLLSSDSNIVQSQFEISPNQTYILGSNSVVEGKAVIALIKKKESKNDKDESKEKSKVDEKNPLSGSNNPLSTIKTIQKLNNELNENKDKY